MTVRFSSISAIEILDSRGNPTLAVTANMSDRRTVGSGVPSGASTGSHEAVELRDHDPARYAGLGVTPRLPVPHFNVVNGGAHAPNALDFQEFMIAPVGAPSIREAVRAGAEIYRALRAALAARHLATGLGDEGGFAPEIAWPEEVLALLVHAISQAGYTPGYATMIDHFPIRSIEDGLGETDTAGWRQLTVTLGDRVQLVGDDNFCTDPASIAAAVDAGIANAALIKVNQVGTVSETLEALRVCRAAGYGAMISHRSGETDDSFIADLAVGSGCGQLKSGAPARGERVAKYNRLVEIAAAAPGRPYGLAPATVRA